MPECSPFFGAGVQDLEAVMDEAGDLIVPLEEGVIGSTLARKTDL